MLVNLDIISAGQLLRTTLRRKDGKILLAKGTILSKSMLTTLRKRGVTRLDVEPAPDRTPESLERATMESELDHRFSLVLDDPFMQSLRRHALNALAGGVSVSSPVSQLEPHEGDSDARDENEGGHDSREGNHGDV